MATISKPSRRRVYDPDHEDFRTSFRAFLDARVVPRYAGWEKAGIVPRSLFAEAGEHGFVGMAVPEEFGGGGVDDFRFNAVIAEEIAATGTVSFGLNLHNDICLPYFLSLADDDQRRRWLPGLASGELIGAIAMTEPGTGSDLAAIATTATTDGDQLVLNGSKTFISNGHNADVVIVVARTEPSAGAHAGLSLVVVEAGTPGFERGRNLEKIGMHAQDTAELSFSDCRVPAANLLGERGGGFRALVSNLPQERMTIAVASVAGAAQALAWTLAYVGERRAFGAAIGSFQNTRFVLADLATQIAVTQAFVDSCLGDLVDGTLGAERAAMAKLAASELQGRAVDQCLQLHGGYGYMAEFPIARAYVDARIGRIYGGTSEVMREIIGRSLDL